MMSQIELWNMQEYCERKNSRREKRAKRMRTFSILNFIIFIAGIVLAALSTCLVAYVLKMNLVFADPVFIAVGAAGIAAGIGACIASIHK